MLVDTGAGGILIDTGERFTYEPKPVAEPTIKQTFITVDGVEYETTGLTSMELLTVKALKISYENFSQEARDIMPFDIYVYNLTKSKIFERIFTSMPDLEETVYDVVDIEPESPEFKARLWYSDLQTKLRNLGISTGILIGVGIVFGIIVLGLVGYQYTQSYVAEKGAEKARGN